ncbi:MAG: QueT transporter family protein [Clostridia bacterium]|nr:QueT transporter family protein [Clostridia bacterium]
MKRKGVPFISQSAIIAALYVVLTMISNMLGLASGAVQLRLSEALAILPVFTGAAVPGLFVGCLISNLLSGCIALDIIFGSLATLIGAYGTYTLRRFKILPFIPPVLANTLIIPFLLVYAYGIEGTVGFFVLTVGAGELLSCGLLGYLLRTAIKKRSSGFKW